MLPRKPNRRQMFELQKKDFYFLHARRLGYTLKVFGVKSARSSASHESERGKEGKYIENSLLSLARSCHICQLV